MFPSHDLGGIAERRLERERLAALPAPVAPVINVPPASTLTPPKSICGASTLILGAGAGGEREGVQQAELQARTLEAMGRAQAQGFGGALGAAQRQQQIGLAAGQQLGNLGAGQQQWHNVILKLY